LTDIFVDRQDYPSTGCLPVWQTGSPAEPVSV